VQLDENEIHTNLLHIEPGGSVPEHTHKGFELTLLLEGSFVDEKGTYVKGDFILLDGNHQHHPVSEGGCLCYTVANDAMHFTQGINKLLNPIGSFIY
jgi:putative transcriptional regulator